MTIKLSFPDSQAAFILELIRNLKFVNIEKEDDIPEWHKAILDESIAEFERNPNDLIDWEDIKKQPLMASL